MTISADSLIGGTIRYELEDVQAAPVSCDIANPFALSQSGSLVSVVMETPVPSAVDCSGYTFGVVTKVTESGSGVNHTDRCNVSVLIVPVPNPTSKVRKQHSLHFLLHPILPPSPAY